MASANDPKYVPRLCQADVKTIAPVSTTDRDNPWHVRPSFSASSTSWTPWRESDWSWTPGVHILEEHLPALHEWNLLVLVEVNFFLDEATRTLNEAQQRMHPGTGKLISWLLCEPTCHIGLLCNDRTRQLVYQLLNQTWPSGWELQNMETFLGGELEQPSAMIAYPNEVFGECPRVYIFEFQLSDSPYDLDGIWRPLHYGGYGGFNERNTVLVSQQASALQRCGVVSLGHNVEDPKSLKNLTPIDELCHCLQNLLAAKPADVADYMQRAAYDSNTSDNNSESRWSCV